VAAGRVYRQDTSKQGEDPQPFFDLTLPDWATTKYWIPDAWNKRTAAYGIATNAKGNLFVCDLVNQQIVEVAPDGKKVAEAKAPWPERVMVNDQTGDLYVISRLDRPKDGFVGKKLVKVTGRGDAAKVVAQMPLKGSVGATSAIGMVNGKAVLWLAGDDDLLCVRDSGDTFEVQGTAYKPTPNGEADFGRMVVDPIREEIYTSNGVNRFWRYDGNTGKGEPLTKAGKPFNGVDLAVAYDGLLYIRTGEGYSGPLERYTRQLEPAPLPEIGSNVITKMVYSRYGVGFCEKGLGVGPGGESYVNFMYGWNKYFVAGFAGTGKAIKGLYLEGKVGRQKLPAGLDPKDPKNKSAVDEVKQSEAYPAELTSSVVGPVPAVCGGVRVDLAGNIYVGAFVKPKGFAPPAAFAKDPAYAGFTGSVVKFGPKGGTFLGLPDAESKQPDAPKIELDAKLTAENGLAVYPGIAPLSGGGYGNNGSSCVCRVARFDVDRFGRLAIPNCVTNSCVVYDNAGNVVCEFGQYGNFDSQYVPPKSDKPLVAAPEIPLAWPTGAGFSERSIYVNDTYNRRIVRTDKTFAAEETCPISK